jgi:hypothetical protein
MFFPFRFIVWLQLNIADGSFCVAPFLRAAYAWFDSRH